MPRSSKTARRPSSRPKVGSRKRTSGAQRKEASPPATMTQKKPRTPEIPATQDYSAVAASKTLVSEEPPWPVEDLGSITDIPPTQLVRPSQMLSQAEVHGHLGAPKSLDDWVKLGTSLKHQKTAKSSDKNDDAVHNDNEPQKSLLMNRRKNSSSAPCGEIPKASLPLYVVEPTQELSPSKLTPAPTVEVPVPTQELPQTMYDSEPMQAKLGISMKYQESARSFNKEDAAVCKANAPQRHLRTSTRKNSSSASRVGIKDASLQTYEVEPTQELSPSNFTPAPTREVPVPTQELPQAMHHWEPRQVKLGTSLKHQETARSCNKNDAVVGKANIPQRSLRTSGRKDLSSTSRGEIKDASLQTYAVEPTQELSPSKLTPAPTVEMLVPTQELPQTMHDCEPTQELPQTIDTRQETARAIVAVEPTQELPPPGPTIEHQQGLVPACVVREPTQALSPPLATCQPTQELLEPTQELLPPQNLVGSERLEPTQDLRPNIQPQSRSHSGNARVCSPVGSGLNPPSGPYVANRLLPTKRTFAELVQQGLAARGPPMKQMRPLGDASNFHTSGLPSLSDIPAASRSSEPTSLVLEAETGASTRLEALIGTCESKVIPDDAIVASSYLRDEPCRGLGQMWRSRLDCQATCWCAATQDRNQYIQWDLGAPKIVSRVQLKGRFDQPQWVSRFDLSYSDDGETWTQLLESFPGNQDQNTMVQNDIVPPFTSRFVRLHPLKWYGRISLRAELLGTSPLTNVNGETKDDVDIVDSSVVAEAASTDLCAKWDETVENFQAGANVAAIDDVAREPYGDGNSERILGAACKNALRDATAPTCAPTSLAVAADPSVLEGVRSDVDRNVTLRDDRVPQDVDSRYAVPASKMDEQGSLKAFIEEGAVKGAQGAQRAVAAAELAKHLADVQTAVAKSYKSLMNLV